MVSLKLFSLAVATVNLAGAIPSPTLSARESVSTLEAGIVFIDFNSTRLFSPEKRYLLALNNTFPTSVTTDNLYKFCYTDESRIPEGNLHALWGTYTLDTDRYWGVCWDHNPFGPNYKFDQAFANEAIDFLAYFTLNESPHNTAAQTSVKDQSPLVSSARANRWYDNPLLNAHIDPRDAQDMIRALQYLGGNSHEFEADFTTRYGVVVTAVEKDGGGNWVPHGTNIDFCGRESACLDNWNVNKDLAKPFASDNAALEPNT
jgi:hypothetical protein